MQGAGPRRPGTQRIHQPFRVRFHTYTLCGSGALGKVHFEGNWYRFRRGPLSAHDGPSPKSAVAFLDGSASNSHIGFVRGWKVFDQSPFTNVAGFQETSEVMSLAGRKSWMESWRSACRNFRPNALALIGLAIAITLWGFGYRLSSYERYPSSLTRAAAAKMCVDPWNSSRAAAAQLKASLHLIVNPPAVSASPHEFPLIDHGAVCPAPEHTPRPVSFRFLIPFRSPPSHRFSLA